MKNQEEHEIPDMEWNPFPKFLWGKERILRKKGIPVLIFCFIVRLHNFIQKAEQRTYTNAPYVELIQGIQIWVIILSS